MQPTRTLFLPLFLLFLFISPASPKLAYYVLTPSTQATFQCLLQSGLTKVILPYMPSQYDDPFNQSIRNARNSGIEVEVVVFFLCRLNTPEEHLKQMIDAIGVGVINKFWILPYWSTSSIQKCSWDKFSPESNCLYLQELIKLGRQKYNLTIGTYVQLENWQAIYHSQQGCPQVGISPMWWLPQDQEDRELNFDHYEQIGGWKVPQMKFLYTQRNYCGVQMRENYWV